MTYQAVLAVIMGVRGIIYFPEGVGCTVTNPITNQPVHPADNTTPAVQSAITRLDCTLAPSQSPLCPPGAIPGPTMQSTVSPIPGAFESGTTTGQIVSGNRANPAAAYVFTVNDSANTYSHVVRFHTPNCAYQVVTVLNDTPSPADPSIGESRVLRLDQWCQTTVPETWGGYGYHIYEIPTPPVALPAG